MDLRLDSAQRRFRDQVRTWLAASMPRTLSVSDLESHRAWEKRLFEAGYAAVHWPEEFGGAGLDPIVAAIFDEEYRVAGAPPRLNRLGLGMVGPTLIEWGTPEQKDRWLQPILRCDELWCQGFSEPEAGSDLASLRTRGEDLGGDIRVNGQKIWTTNAAWADWMFALVRTNPEARRHTGLTFLMIDMRGPGVTVRPIRQISGQQDDFFEVFLTDVMVPRANVIGQIGSGWPVAMSTLRHERSSNLNTASHFRSVLTEFLGMVPDELRADQRLQEEVGRLYEEIEAYRFMTLRTLSEQSSGKDPGPQALMGKLWWSEMQARMYELSLEVLGPWAEVVEPDGVRRMPPDWSTRYWSARAARIYAGTNEIQRNIIAERVLSLPREAKGVL